MEAVENLYSVLEEFESQHIVPVIIRKQNQDKAEWIYANTYVENLKQKCSAKVTTREERIRIMKKIIDSYIDGRMSVPVVHAAVLCLYVLGQLTMTDGESLSEKEIGLKRFKAFSKLPEINIFPDDEFFTYQLQSL